jgi:hypothetical protein
MKTAGELRADAERWCDIAGRVSDPDLLVIRESIEELEARAREIENERRIDRLALPSVRFRTLESLMPW